MSAFPTHHNTGSQELVEVYDADFSSVLSLPRYKIEHMPSSQLGLSRLVLCRNFTSPQFQCPKGSQCKFVHAHVDKSVKAQSIHVNYAWRSLSEVKYARLKAGRSLLIAAPNNRGLPAPLPSEMVLRTKGSTKQRPDATMQHCAHFYFNRMCNRGENCNFIHSVYIDPNASEFEKAPSPAAYLHRLQAEMMSTTKDTAHSDSISSVGTCEDSAAGDEDEPITHDKCSTHAHMYRHNPYSIHSSKVMLCHA